MNYQQIYNNLISKGRVQILDPDTYTENHHVIPRCMGGSDDESNLVRLTPEQHYVAHQLLAKIHKLPGLYYAAKVMCAGEARSNKLYGWIRRRSHDFAATSIQNAWAKKYGFRDYVHQCEMVWDKFTELGGIKKTSVAMGISEINAINSINHWCDLQDLWDTKVEIIKQRKSENSTSSRLAEPKEKRQRRAAVMNETKDRAKCSDAKKGSRNPRARPIEIDGIVYGCMRDAFAALGFTEIQWRSEKFRSKYTWRKL